PRGVADPDPWHPRYLPPAQAPAGDPPAAGGRAGGHPHRAADQGLRLRDHEQAGLADAQRGGIRRGRPDLRDPRGTRPVGRAGALRPRGARPGARARRAGDRAAAGGGLMTPQQALLPALARRLGAAALALALPLGALPALGDGPDGPPALPPGARGDPGDPAQEAAPARAEDLRIADVRSMVDSSRWAFAPGAPPLTLPTGGTSTVVLLAREEPYTLEELAEVVPEAVEREEDGDLLISSHLVIDRGATLRIRTEGEHAVHLESTPESFASLVSIGGTLDVAGAEGEPLRITGWDSSRDRADEETADGRAYLRALAGAVRARDVDLSDLGFWSGPTGGLALTGSDAPRIETAAGDVIADPGEESAVAPDPDSMVALPDPGQERAEDPTSATLERVSVRNGAMGLFAVNTAELDVHDAEFSDNLLDGVVLHRFVTGATLADVEAHRNGGDGVRAGRGTTDVSIERARTARNDRNGITLEGGSLADGPSATGVATGAFGGHTVTDSTVTRNGRYGIQVTGGTGMALHGNYVTG